MRDALKDLADQFWPRDAVGDGTVGVDASVVGGVSVDEAREAVVLHNADPPVRAPELTDHAHRDFHGVVDDIVLADRVHAVDGQASISVEARPGNHGRLERIALLARQAMVVADRVHIEVPVHQVVDIRLLGRELEQVCDVVFEHGRSFHGWCPGPLCASGLLATKVRALGGTLVPDWRGFATLGCAGSLGL